MLYNDCPYKFKIDPEVLVDGHISEPDYLRPRDLRVSFAQFLGYAPEASPSNAKRCSIAL
jgi:hypothetical protein